MAKKSPAKATSKRPQVAAQRLDKLVLNQWVLSLFNVKHFEETGRAPSGTRRWKGSDENRHPPLRTTRSRLELFNLMQLPAELTARLHYVSKVQI